jgi:hypothetical protein
LHDDGDLRRCGGARRSAPPIPLHDAVDSTAGLGTSPTTDSAAGNVAMAAPDASPSAAAAPDAGAATASAGGDSGAAAAVRVGAGAKITTETKTTTTHPATK